MKKNLILSLVAMCFAINIYAQEVHGVESRMVCTDDCNPDGNMYGKMVPTKELIVMIDMKNIS